MFTLSNILAVSRRKVFIRFFMTFFIMTLVSAPGLMANGKRGSHSATSNISCGSDSLCKSIENDNFDLILYSALGSEIVILYQSNTVGNIIPKVNETYFSKATGTVKDAIYYLSRHSEYSGFRFKKARKTKGFFRSEVIDGVYVAVPAYLSSSDNRAPKYSFSDKDGTLKVRITPVVEMSGN